MEAFQRIVEAEQQTAQDPSRAQEKHLEDALNNPWVHVTLDQQRRMEEELDNEYER